MRQSAAEASTDAFIVAVDGPSGSGKSSTARGVASRLGFGYLDTGAMYRAVTWALLESGVDLSDADAIGRAAESLRIESGTDPRDERVAVDGVDVARSIRGHEVTAAVSAVAAVPAVRARLVEVQRAAIAAARSGIVVEGRDIGSVVAPDADVKVFLVAHADARAVRRSAELEGADPETTARDLARRDELDSRREASPLTRAGDAVEIDGTHLTLEQVIDEVVALVEGAEASA